MSQYERFESKIFLLCAINCSSVSFFSLLSILFWIFINLFTLKKNGAFVEGERMAWEKRNRGNFEFSLEGKRGKESFQKNLQASKAASFLVRISWEERIKVPLEAAVNTAAEDSPSSECGAQIQWIYQWKLEEDGKWGTECT